jgi:hypothetical protein
MLTLGIRYVRVFNLCDLRNPDSQTLKSDHVRAKQFDSKSIFSITFPNRIKEVEKSIQESKIKLPMLGWGENRCLKKYANEALLLFPKHFGVARKTPWFGHPSPRRKDQKLRWLDSLYDQITKHNNKECI